MTTFSVDGVLFDNDGVLVDSHPQVVAAWTALATEYHLDIDRLLIELIGRRAADTLGQYLDGDALQAATRRLEDLEVGAAVDTQPLAGALELLAQLPVGTWTIVTSGSSRLATARWQGAGIPIPANVVTADDVTAGKPDPEPFLVGARRLGMDPLRTVVFEDSPSGGQAGLAAGATVIAVGNQPWPGEPHARVTDLSQVSATARADGGVDIHIDGT